MPPAASAAASHSILHTKLPHSASSESLGFRPPQFSEDAAWLPEWLQPHVAAIALEQGKDSQKHVGSSVKEASQSREYVCQEKNPNGLLVKDVKKEGLRLHLSGDDDSPVSAFPCPEKVLLFTLHLSTDGSPSSHYIPTIEISQNERLKSIAQSVEDLIEGDDTDQSNIESKHGNMKLFSSACNQNKSASPSSQTQCNPQDAQKQFSPKLDGLNSTEHEISDAVELSTAASETLVIYELIKGEPYSDALSTTTILELALWVKQTRLQWVNDILTFSNSNDRISSSDLLSDLDDSDMEDAYGDVGLSLSSSPDICSKGTSVSQVAETPIFKQSVGENGTAGSKNECQEDNVYKSGAETQLEMLQIDLAVDIADAEKENLVINNDHLDLVPNVAHSDDLMTHQLHQRISDEIISQQEDASRGAKCRRIKHFRENLIETSYFSESADVAPDLNSCVHRHDESLRISQSSIHIEVLRRRGNNGTLLSHDLAKDSVLSSVDPLCSVIPCSISSRTHGYSPAHTYNDEKHNGDIMVMPEIDLEAQNMHITSCPKDQTVYREKQGKTAFNSHDSYLNQHTTSLDVYSMQSPTWQPFLLLNDSNHVQAQQTESAMDARSVSCERKTTSVNSLPNERHRAANNGAELKISLQNEEMTPPILCHGIRHRVQAHKHPISSEYEKQSLVHDSLARFDPSGILKNPHIQHGKFPDICISTRKRVRFDDDDFEYQKKWDSPKLISKYRSRKCSSSGKRTQPPNQQHCWSSQEVKEHLTNFDRKDKKKPIFQGLDFLLTGFPCKKEKEVERILRRYGGAILSGIPSPRKKGGRRIGSDSVQLPVVICTKKLQTRKFLYGCAVNAFLLRVDWVTDSIAAGSVLPPVKYLILPNQQNKWANRILKPIHLRTVDRIFCKVGIMLHGEHDVCKLAEVIKHGQGCVYKSLHGMVQSLKNKRISIGVIIADNESYATRHLRKCASEQGIPVMSTSWIINCIYNGKLLPFEESSASSRSAPIEIQAVSASQEWTQEI